MFEWMFSTKPYNKNARIESRVDRTGKLRTETVRRDTGSDVMAVSTDKSSNSTNVYIDRPGLPNVRLSGREARTLYSLLQAHYAELGKAC